MKKILALILALMAFTVAFASCNDEQGESSSSSTESQSSSESDIPSSTQQSSSSSKGNTSEYPEIPKIEYSADVSQTIDTTVFADFSAFGNKGEVESYTSVKSIDVSVNTVNISTPGIYRLYGTTTKGQIVIDIDRVDDTAPLQQVILVLDNVSITSASDASSIPPIYSKGCDLTIVIPKNTVNTITDTVTNSEKGAIYVKTGNLTIDGEGTLKVRAKHKSAIFCTKCITVNGGIFDLEANYHGIYGEGGLKYGVEDIPENHNGVIINSGDFTIVASKSAIKAGDYEKDNLPEVNVLGNIIINDGKFDLSSTGDSIDCYGGIEINGGGFEIVSKKDGLNATMDVVFGGTSKTVMVIDAQDNGIKSDSAVKLLGTTNVKVNSIKDAIDAIDVEIDIDGILYLKTNAKFVEDKNDGDYIIDNKEYYKVDRTLYEGKVFYAIDGSSKGIDGKNSIVIKNGLIAIDSDEEAIVSTDGSTEDATTANTVTISGGTINIDTRESAIKADNSITVSSSAKLCVMKSDKGLNADNVTIHNGNLTIVSISDAIDADNVVVNNGSVYLFDKVDLPGTGTFTVNGGMVVCISTTKTPKGPTSSVNKMIAKSIENASNYVFGNYINIKGEGLDVVLKIPKSYAEKVAVSVTTPSMTAGEYTISVGSYENGTISNLVCTDGEFVAISSEIVTAQ